MCAESMPAAVLAVCATGLCMPCVVCAWCVVVMLCILCILCMVLCGTIVCCLACRRLCVCVCVVCVRVGSPLNDGHCYVSLTVFPLGRSPRYVVIPKHPYKSHKSHIGTHMHTQHPHPHPPHLFHSPAPPLSLTLFYVRGYQRGT